MEDLKPESVREVFIRGSIENRVSMLYTLANLDFCSEANFALLSAAVKVMNFPRRIGESDADFQTAYKLRVKHDAEIKRGRAGTLCLH